MLVGCMILSFVLSLNSAVCYWYILFHHLHHYKYIYPFHAFRNHSTNTHYSLANATTGEKHPRATHAPSTARSWEQVPKAQCLVTCACDYSLTIRGHRQV